MVGFLSWVDSNFTVIQTVGIIGSILLGIAAANRESKEKAASNLLVIEAQHLARIFRLDADLSQPISIAEEEFLRLVISHFQTIWLIARNGGLLTLKELALDAQDFFALPLPRAVWEKTKAFRNPKFVRFVERAMERQLSR
jgi:hypothetical protein